MVELRNILASLGSRIAAAFFIPLAFWSTLISAGHACSPPRSPPAPEKVFQDSIAVFKGVVTSAELIDVSEFAIELGPVGEDLNVKELKSLPIVKVRWRVEEVFKGRLIEGQSAWIAYIMCVDHLIVVGLPYMFSIKRSDDALTKRLMEQHPDMIGYIAVDGTAGIQDEGGLTYERLEESFRSLSKK
jgi:hypothetical protein